LDTSPLLRFPIVAIDIIPYTPSVCSDIFIDWRRLDAVEFAALIHCFGIVIDDLFIFLGAASTIVVVLLVLQLGGFAMAVVLAVVARSILR
jgi:hypothetical protein